MTSKIYKPHINGKPKRPGTHQYPHLGPKVAVVAGNIDPTVGRICFCRIFQTVMDLEHGNEFIGSKNGGKEVWVGLKWTKDTKIWRPKLATAVALGRPDPGGSGGGWPKIFAGVVVWSSSSSLYGACTVVVAGIGSHG